MSLHDKPRSNTSAEAYDQKFVPWYFQPRADELLGAAPPVPGGTALDLACGSGLIARNLLERETVGVIHAADANAGMLAYAAARLDDPRVAWHEADASALPIEDASVDVAYCHQGLQYFPDRPAAIAELARVLAPGGRVAIAVWGALERNPFIDTMVAEFGPFFGDDTARALGGACALDDPAELARLLRKGGLTDVEVRESQLIARHPDARTAIDDQISSLPFTDLVEALGTRRVDLVDTLCEARARYIDEAGAIAIPTLSNIGLATRA